MKKMIFGLGVVVLSIFACKKHEPVDYALLSGKIENFNGTDITLGVSGNVNMKKITVAPDGTFKDTIRSTPDLFMLKVGDNISTVYLDKGNDIIFNADAKNFKTSVHVSGNGAEVTKYLKYKNKKSTELKGSTNLFYKLDEASFKDKAKEISKTLLQIVDTVKGISDTYKTLEKRNLNYVYLNELTRYEEFHQRFTENPEHKTSEHLLDELKGLDVNNADDYKFSGAYKQLVNRYYSGKINDLVKKDSLEYSLAELAVYSKIPDQTIKNELLFTGARKGISKTDSLDYYYQNYMQASTNEENNVEISNIYNGLKKITKGEISPKFVDYESYAGGTTSLDDFKGNYVYIDVWATWCAPCIQQIPFLKQVENKYHGKNISFISLSIDEAKNYDKWKNMVNDKALSGIQLIADNNFRSQFIQDFLITSIPRFILIDPQGVIINSNAPRPSSPELVELFNELNI